MIWQLAREQLRSQKRYVLWTGVLLSLTVAVATFGALTVTTQNATDEIGATLNGQSGPWHLNADSAGIDADGSGNLLSEPEVNRAIATAAANGSDVVASRYLSFGLATDDSGPYDVIALTGDIAWDQILVAGEPPKTGQVAVPAQYAQDHGLAIGDDASLTAFQSEFETELEISGLTYSPVSNSAFFAWGPHGYVAWEDSAALAADFKPQDARSSQLFTQLSWSEGDPALNALSSPYNGGPFYMDSATNYGAGSSTTGYTIVIGFVLLLGLFAMAFAVGRSQAQARMKWVATARTLGATRSTIATATVVENLLVGLIAGVLGIILGYLATAVALTASRTKVLEPALPEHVATPWPVLVGALILGVVLAVIIGLIPAFWASRVSPVAALKPMDDLTEAELSRRVSSLGIYFVWGAVLLGLAGLRWLGSEEPLLAGLSILLTITSVALGIAVVMDALRHTIAWLGRRLSNLGRPWAIAAGDALSARPRQVAIPAFIMTALMAGVVLVVTYAYLSSYAQRALLSEGGTGLDWLGYVPSSQNTFAQFLGVTAAGLLVVTLTTLAIAGSAQRSIGADAATREALGLTPGASRLAAGFQYGAPLAVGVVAGWAIGQILALWLVPGIGTDGFGNALSSTQQVSGWISTTLPVLVVVICGFATAVIVGVIIALTTRTGAPVRQLQHVS